MLVNGTVQFPETVKYPSIPCYVDSSITSLSLIRKGLLTGPEYLLAKNQGCKIKVSSAFYMTSTEVAKSKKIGIMRITTHSETIKPFYSFIKEIQGKRKEYPKGHVLNLLYKEMGIPFTEMLYEVCQIRRVLIQ